MTKEGQKRELLAWLPGTDREAVTRAAEATGVVVRWETSATAVARALLDQSFAGTLLRLEDAFAEIGLVQRIAAEPAAGALIVSVPTVSLSSAVAVQRAGAIAVLGQSIDGTELEAVLLSIADRDGIVPLSGGATAEVDDEGLPNLIGSSPRMASVFEAIARVSRSESTVLVTGESGTGKELVARALHAASDRAEGPFIAINCAALPEHLLESELFGHERGAFTGAVARQIGRFERADGGTLFLDEIGDMSLVLQAKVLRVLEDRVVERLGSREARTVDVRVVAATNKDLRDGVEVGDFREDLLYRLAVVEVELPPLRDRGGDIRELALAFAFEFSKRHGRVVTGFTTAALDRLEKATWRGNVRELRNVIDRAVLLAAGDVIRPADLQLGDAAPRQSPRGRTAAPSSPVPTASLAEVEAEHIERVLRHVNGRMVRAADILGIHRNTLTRKMREYGIRAHVAVGA